MFASSFVGGGGDDAAGATLSMPYEDPVKVAINL
jgi:nanoRNase/pAp phosphatase (c-di-AMP/oligoRNAs hydrolase)